MTHPLDRPEAPEPEALVELRAELDRQREQVKALEARWLDAAAKHKRANPRLVYAERTRCECGAGMAYLTTEGLRGSWQCSAVLKAVFDGAAIEGVHTEPKPFMFYEIKSELQPSAEGRSTRPT